MIVLDVKQLSEEWFNARVGIPSASNFDKIVTSAGVKSKQRTKYLYTLAGERIIGKKEESYQNATMVRGMELEGEARDFYRLLKNVDIEETGLCFADDKLYACSPDGLIEKNGGIEIKCPILSTHVQYLVDNCVPIGYFQQIQGSMLVTGREWWDFMSYYPGMKPLIIRVKRDESFLANLEKQLIYFCKELMLLTERIK